MEPRSLPSMMRAQRIAVFDVCGTITRANNTFAFIGFVLKKDNAFRYCILMLTRFLCPLFNALRIDRVAGRDLLRDWQIRLLKGYSVDRIKELSGRYVERLFAERLLNEEVMEAMKQEAEQGRTLLLVSSSIDPPITALAGRLNIERCFASELAVENGRCTGRLRTDLTGNKQCIFEKMRGDVDLQDSSVYSDNVKDASFMQMFGVRNVVVNSPEMARRWGGADGRADLVVSDEARMDRDTGSVNSGTAKWIYVPSLYYAISRLHRRGVLSLLLREVVPYTLAGCWLIGLGPAAFILIPLSVLMFYSVYETGGLVNDLLAGREAAQHRTSRIAPGTKINAGVFVLIRLAFVACTLTLLGVGAYTAALYAGLLVLCLAVYLIHSVILGSTRVVTFVLLKVCRNAIPWAILLGYVPVLHLACLCAIFFVVDTPLRVYWYCYRRGLAKGTMSKWYIRPLTEVALCGLGTVVYLIDGSPSLGAIALYYLVLDGLWGVLRKRSQFKPVLLRQMK
jgi:HAD superfamily phosphoserine phosphatase-like hydrolase